ncbi:MAG: 4-(cytidine 5'-diphospho)-2-C-methyl-D-erythritol kinase [Elusimicrobia bacterium]|nr:4-(cytidine 5'-diphospho)-2-C-methyl-D-erythritol kinase [Elusimicrobiota bacterium]
MIIKAYAKLNLFLEITGKRKDGYHNILSLFALTDLADIIEVKKTKKLGISLETKNFANLESLPKEKNLAYKAASAFCETFCVKPSHNIKIKKYIPAGAGLGGGSSDCAAVLKALCFLEKIDIKEKSARKKLFSLALKLGADVPFFLSGEKAAVCSLKGEKIRPLKIASPMPKILIIWPDAFVSTPAVYKSFKMGSQEDINKKKKLLKEFEKKLSFKKAFDFSPYLFNRLENGAFKISKNVEKTAGILKSDTKGNALMTGSGGAVFAISYDIEELKRLKNRFSSLHKFIFLAKFI